MTRKQFLNLSALSGVGSLLPACEGLRELEKRPEGAGVQIVSGVLFLAKYKATPGQVAQARQKGAMIYVSRGLKPVTQEKLRALKASPPAGPSGRGQAPAGAEPPADPLEKERQTVVASYYATVRKAVGGNIPASLNLDTAPVADIPPDPRIARELQAMVSRRNLVEKTLALQVTGSGVPAEQQNPSAVTVVNFDTRALEVTNENAYVLARKPRSGELIALDGTRAAYQN